MRALYLCWLLLSAVLPFRHANVEAEHTTWLDEIHASTVPQDDELDAHHPNRGTDFVDYDRSEQVYSNSTDAYANTHGRALQTTTLTASYCSYPAVCTESSSCRCFWLDSFSFVACSSGHQNAAASLTSLDAAPCRSRTATGALLQCTLLDRGAACVSQCIWRRAARCAHSDTYLHARTWLTLASIFAPRLQYPTRRLCYTTTLTNGPTYAYSTGVRCGLRCQLRHPQASRIATS